VVDLLVYQWRERLVRKCSTSLASGIGLKRRYMKAMMLFRTSRASLMVSKRGGTTGIVDIFVL
jgi:hypothetical protein